MSARIIGIGTAVPPTVLPQGDVRDLFAGQPGTNRLTARLIGAAFDHSDIDTRHSVLSELAADGGAAGSAFVESGSRRILQPPTGARNAVYAREAPGLFAAAARDALDRAGVETAAVTHVVTASCTGFFAPGPEFRLMRDLGLDSTVPREHLGFMGCAAALPALRSAARICAADPTAVVLVVCAEICTIHLRPSDDPDQIVSSAVFADGAAAAIVTASAPVGPAPHLELDGFATATTEEGESDMAWTIGDSGFEMTLTAEVPRIIGREVREALAPLQDAAGTIDTWAVHPGGRSILDRVESAFALPAAALAPSRDVLRRYGNMSSATVLFILQRVLADTTARDGSRVLALAFAPGLTVESALLTLRTPAATPEGSSQHTPEIAATAATVAAPTR
ncbi:type III polyketide synthase [Microbacterium telephonicum]|uniref:Putative naringenin-chalcone synthase n=1 Tax=Microbacterium telephonicum TaxID=1714841 RepID=A0A498C0F4_9MICO|nr:type III polyketide synthase [Microbacterium telephonicum]RLK46610.1 putative naringenin-chalcone synthase [Microbacterium telephonicum]